MGFKLSKGTREKAEVTASWSSVHTAVYSVALVPRPGALRTGRSWSPSSSQTGQALSTGAWLPPFPLPEVSFLSLPLPAPQLPLGQPSAVSSKVTSSRKPA